MNDTSLSFSFESGAPVADGDGRRAHDADVPAVTGHAYVRVALAMGSDNPAPYAAGHPKGAQCVTFGEKAGDGGGFTPAVRFGLADAFRGGRKDDPERPGALLTAWLSDGTLDYFGACARPETPYDFRLHVDLTQKRVTAWVSGREDDEWLLLAEDAPLISPVSAINHLRVEQCPGAAGIEDLTVRSEAWDPDERPRPHPLAKKDRAVQPDKGFVFRSPMRSTWRLSGRHVAVSRQPERHHAFGDVALGGPGKLVAAWTNKSHSGGTLGISIARSDDLGRTWREGPLVHPGARGCVRIQRLTDGSLLLISDVTDRKDYQDVVLYDSHDGGETWGNQRWIRAERSDTGGLSEPSRVVELPDGSWLVATASYGGTPWNITERSYLEIHRSTDRGRTWELHATVRAAAPHHPNEPSIVALPDGRLVVYAREWRYDGLPGLRGVSTDGGRNWQMRALPFSITGRVCAGLLDDGRAMITFRSGIGRAALWAWVGDPDDPTGFQPAGTHYNDRYTVGLKDEALHIDNDGMLGQFTQYFLRPADTAESTVDVTAEVKVVSNRGRAATLSVPFVGKLRLFPDRVELAHEPSVHVPVTPGQFHVYRVVRKGAAAELYVDGELALRTDKIDARPWRDGAFRISIHPLSFGNEREEADAHTNVYTHEITPEAAGYSIWRRVEEKLDDPATGKRTISWSARRDGFPDQYQLDHMIEIEASAAGGDQGYSGWVPLADGRIFVVNYTDDTAPMVRWDPYDGGVLGITWMRGTYLLRSDLPTKQEK